MFVFSPINYFLYKFRYPKKLQLDRVTLLGIDCIDPKRLLECIKLCEEFIDFGDVKLLSSIPIQTPYWKEIPVIESIEKYSEFVLNKLTNYVDTDYVLLIQYDGFVLNPMAWSDDFLKYDYIGAPWWFHEGNNIGNGGFNLRSKKFLNLTSQLDQIKITEPEDVFVCRTHFHHLVNHGIKFAPYHIANKFSLEGRMETFDKWEYSFGFHGFNVTDLRRWKYYNFVKPTKLFYWFNVMKGASNLIHEGKHKLWDISFRSRTKRVWDKVKKKVRKRK